MTNGGEEKLEKIEGAPSEEFEDITFTPGWTIISILGFMNEVVDLISLFLDFTGIWVIISYGADLILFFIFVGWRIAEEGFSLSAIFRNWKQFLALLLEHIPVIEDIFPGWIFTIFGFRKKKIKKTK